MSPLAPVFDRLGQDIAELTGRIGCRVEIGDLGVTDRAGHLTLGEPGLVSPNGACRLVQASDGWIAVNLARKGAAVTIFDTSRIGPVAVRAMLLERFPKSVTHFSD